MQASVEAVETRQVPTADAAPAVRTPTTSRRRRIPQGAIELAGLALGIGIIAAVALGNRLSNDEFWQMAAGQWMLAHHSIMGLDPFSYTEAHRRWVTDEWGSEITLAGLYKAFGASAYDVYAIVLGSLSLAAAAVYARTLGRGAAGSPPSSWCWRPSSPGRWRATAASTSRCCGCRSSWPC